MEPYYYQTARDLFESAKSAAIDVRKCSRQLDALEESAARLPFPSLEPRVRSSPRDRMADAVGSLVDRGASLRKRMENDYRLIDVASTVLYGADGTSGGLAAIAPTWWADAIYHHYLGLRTWAQVGDLLCYSPEHCCRMAMSGLDIIDANGISETIAGIGCAT